MPPDSAIIELPGLASDLAKAAGSRPSSPRADGTSIPKVLNGGPRGPGNLPRLPRTTEPVAVEIVIEKYRSPVFAYVRARVVREQDADDLTQEVFLRWCRAKERFDPQGNPRAFLLGIARNVLREFARSRRRQECTWTEICLEVEASPEMEPAWYSTYLHLLPRCLSRLAPRARQAVNWYYGSQLRMEEIGKRLQCTAGSVKVLVHRARQVLKKCVERQSPPRKDAP